MIEIIAESVDDAVEAEAGGAGRIELVRNLALGGLTPSLGLIREVVAAVQIPVRVMVRENTADVLDHHARLRDIAAAVADCRPAGLVLGFVRGGLVDIEGTCSVLEAARGLPATFHRALEKAPDRDRALRDVKQIVGIDRVLLRAVPAEARDLRQRLEPELGLIVGGGLNLQIVRDLVGIVREVHCGSAARVDGRVERGRVASLVRAFTIALSPHKIT
ncbi:MAG: hypothetical protein K2X35_19465 [Bryobacteraceae bacterium]|nr:hypothetical protein [Bryobacteraceae bacterium]